MSNDQPTKIGCNQPTKSDSLANTSESDIVAQIIQQKLQLESEQKRNLDDMKTEQLFLLEVLVNSVEVTSEALHTDEPSSLCVKVKFIDFPCIDICEDDFYKGDDDTKVDSKLPGPMVPPCGGISDKPSSDKPPQPDTPRTPDKKVSSKKPPDKKTDKKSTAESYDTRSIKSEKSIKSESKKYNTKESTKSTKKAIKEVKQNNKDVGSGKSCMFPMLPLELIRQIQRYPLAVQVFRKSIDKVVPIGHCKVRLGTQFEDAIIKAVYENDPLPVTSVLECDVTLTNSLNDETGRLSIFIRLSCFGATIVTQFLLREHQDYVFKTSKKDNTTEAQRKKGFLYSVNQAKSDNNVKHLASKNDISPFESILTDENIILSSAPKSMDCRDEINKIVPWRKYVQDCGCENLNEYQSGEGSCGFESQQTNCCQQNNQPNTKPPCPLPDCDCYGSEERTMIKQMPNKCPVGDCDCYNSRPQRNLDNRSCCQQNNPSNGNGPGKLRSGCCNGSQNISKGGKLRGGCCNGDQGTSEQGKLRSGCCRASQNVTSDPGHGSIDQNNPSHGNGPGKLRSGCCNGSQNISKGGKLRGGCCNGDQGTSEQGKLRSGCCRASQNVTSDPGHGSIDQNRTSQQRQNETKISSGQIPNNANTFTSTCNDKFTKQDCTQSFRHQLTVNSQRYSSDRYRNSLIEKSFREPREKHDCCRTSEQTKNVDNCFFAEMHVKQQQPDPCASNNKVQTSPCGCKLGINNRGEQYCYNDDAPPIAETKPDAPVVETETQEQHAPNPEQPPPLTNVGPAKKTDKEPHKNKDPGGGDNKPPISPQLTTGPNKDSLNLKVNEKPSTPTQKKPDARPEESSKRANSHKEKTLLDKGGGDGASEKEIHTAKKKQKKYYQSFFRYTAGMYPGINVGHKTCTKTYRMVPKTMGWLWNLKDTGYGLPTRRGWRPGAITKICSNRIKNKEPVSTTESDKTSKASKPTKKKKQSRARTDLTASSQNLSDTSIGPPPPTLHVHKKDGAYFIAMKPLKTDSEDDDDENGPLMFKILPHEDEVSTSSESSLEIEFTAPGAFRKKPIKPKTVEMDTQYSESLAELNSNAKGAATKKEGKGKKGNTSDKMKVVDEKTSSSTFGPTENQWDADQPTQVAKNKK